MPRVNLYIRKEDEARWAALPNKSEFIHNALTGMHIRFSENVERVDLIDVSVHKKSPIVEVAEALKKAPVPIKSRFGLNSKTEVVQFTCKHGADPKFCKFATAGKPCK